MFSAEMHESLWLCVCTDMKNIAANDLLLGFLLQVCGEHACEPCKWESVFSVMSYTVTVILPALTVLMADLVCVRA